MKKKKAVVGYITNGVVLTKPPLSFSLVSQGWYSSMKLVHANFTHDEFRGVASCTRHKSSVFCNLQMLPSLGYHIIDATSGLRSPIRSHEKTARW